MSTENTTANDFSISWKPIPAWEAKWVGKTGQVVKALSAHASSSEMAQIAALENLIAELYVAPVTFFAYNGERWRSIDEVSRALLTLTGARALVTGVGLPVVVLVPTPNMLPGWAWSIAVASGSATCNLVHPYKVSKFEAARALCNAMRVPLQDNEALLKETVAVGAKETP